MALTKGHRQGSGNVINISSIASIRPDPVTAPYGAAESSKVRHDKVLRLAMAQMQERRQCNG
jgi:short-subunit dehydrogenase